MFSARVILWTFSMLYLCQQWRLG